MGNKVSTLVEEEAEVRKFNMFPAYDTRDWSIHFKDRYPENVVKVEDLEDIILLYYNNEANKQDVTFYCKQLHNTLNLNNTTVGFNEIMLAFSILIKGSAFEKNKMALQVL